MKPCHAIFSSLQFLLIASNSQGRTQLYIFQTDNVKMQRHSVASFPYILKQDNSVDDKPNLLELLSPYRENVSCSGQTVKLHQRLPGSGNKVLYIITMKTTIY